MTPRAPRYGINKALNFGKVRFQARTEKIQDITIYRRNKNPNLKNGSMFLLDFFGSSERHGVTPCCGFICFKWKWVSI